MGRFVERRVCSFWLGEPDHHFTIDIRSDGALCTHRAPLPVPALESSSTGESVISCGPGGSCCLGAFQAEREYRWMGNYLPCPTFFTCMNSLFLVWVLRDSVFITMRSISLYANNILIRLGCFLGKVAFDSSPQKLNR